MKRIARNIGLLGLLVLSTSLHAQTLEEQLRTQLRDARSQLQDLQNEQAQWQNQKAAAEKDRDQARKALEQAQAELTKLRGNSAGGASALAAERSAREQAQSDVQRGQQSLAAATAKVREQEARAASANTQLNELQGRLTTCTAKNQELYKIGHDILDAYSNVGLGTVLSSRQPFAAASRVKLENAAQGYGDRLYEQKLPAAATSAARP
jgi:chromosome segregation ATPase